MFWIGWRVGQVVAARYGWGTHMGIVTGFDRWGRPLVTSNSMAAGCVVEEPIAEFARDSAPENRGFPSKLTRAEVVRRARSQLGQPYGLLTNNCEHLVSFALGRTRESPQAQRAVAVALVTLFAILGSSGDGADGAYA